MQVSGSTAMIVARSKLRRSAERAGPVLIALLLGAVLVGSSVLSYRDAKAAAAVVAERQGIVFLHRVERLLGRGAIRPDDARAALDANRGLGLTYIAVFDQGTLAIEVGQALLAGTRPVVGAPAFGHGRVRMVGPGGSGPRPFPDDAPSQGPPVDPPPPPGPPPFGDSGPEGRPFFPPGEWPRSPDAGGGPPPHQHDPGHELTIEFEPIGSEDAVRRALTVLILSSGAAALLTAAALILWAGARRAERVDLRLSAQRHLAQLGEMSAVLAHEIRNPLASLKGHAQLLAEKIEGNALAPRVDRVVKEALRLEQLTNDLLDFARSGAISVAAASPGGLLDRAALATNPERIDRSTKYAPATWPLDAARIEQVLINLLDNALQVTAPPLKVEARVLREGNVLVYTVRDHGPGVPAAERARIFEPFHTTKVRGTGLGLAVAKRIIELHGGRIDILDAPGDGAEFRVYIPAGGTAHR